MAQYFPEVLELWWECKNWIRSNYETKVDVKGTTRIDTSTLASKTDLASFEGGGGVRIYGITVIAIF